MLEPIRHRLYSDFLLPNRLDEFRALLERALDLGYQPHSIASYRRLVEAGVPDGARILVLRRDVDTDPTTARMMFEIERALDAPASYFFRLSTVDVELMREIASFGSEASYHFEEIATVAKERRLTTRDEVQAHLPAIQARFRGNLMALRGVTGLPMRIVAAHGDMANRRLGVLNQELLTTELREELGIEAEVYDLDLNAGLTSRFSDREYPEFWSPHDPRLALERGDRVVYMLTHPRHWRRNVTANIREDLSRVRDGLRYRVPGKGT